MDGKEMRKALATLIANTWADAGGRNDGFICY